MMNDTPEPQSRPIMTEEYHLYSIPPHPKAMRSIKHGGTNSANPMRSSRTMASFHVGLAAVDDLASGIRMKKRMIAVIAPSGRLM